MSDPKSKAELLENHFDSEHDGKCHVEVCQHSVVQLVFLFSWTVVELCIKDSKLHVAEPISSVTVQ